MKKRMKNNRRLSCVCTIFSYSGDYNTPESIFVYTYTTVIFYHAHEMSVHQWNNTVYQAGSVTE